MNPVNMGRAIRRWWLVALLGLVLSVGGSGLAYTLIGAEYQRSASQVLVPGDNAVPEGGNPFIYLGGLEQAADVLVRAAAAAHPLPAACSSAYLMWTPETAREITSRWISAVPSKMS